jgi:heptosyltransferase-2
MPRVANVAAGSARAHLWIRAPNWVGDLVMATPILEAAVRDPRFARVTIALRAHLAPVLAEGPCSAHVLPLERGESETRILRELRPDLALLLSNSLGAAWRAFRAGVPWRGGAALSGRGLLLTHRVVPPQRDGRRVPVPTAHLQADVAGLAGILPESLHPRLHFGAATRAAVQAELERLGLPPGERYVLCAPAAAFGAAKLWPPEHHAATLDALHERHGLRAVVTGAPGEEREIQAVARACAHRALDFSSAKRDLERLKPLVAGASLLLSNDSGPRWFAAAFDVPCVTVMGPNFPELTASSLERTEVVRLEDLECAPCLERTCPLEHHRCMRALQPERAIAAAERLLARAGG